VARIFLNDFNAKNNASDDGHGYVDVGRQEIRK